ncbi:thrombopoietin [Brienomyrus brachyistius]|uniref:thrombopoietin n=1 Tax=Brienomyrus brachyistius TaxID=42636 RepID=UPI0020B28C35|nr:thrombopoietin [Brienomyrus brachyistius]
MQGPIFLLIFLAAGEVGNIQARPIDFVCDDHARRDMNTLKKLEAAMSGCSSSASLPSPIQLPCVKIHKASWDKKSLQQKTGEVQAALEMLGQDVRATMTLSQPTCQLSLLQQLEHSISNYLHVVTHLEITGQVEKLNFFCPSERTNNLGFVLWNFGRLLSGKLEWLVAELKDRCQVGRPTTNI